MIMRWFVALRGRGAIAFVASLPFVGDEGVRKKEKGKKRIKNPELETPKF